MNSPLPKVLHPVAGIPMLARVVGIARRTGSKEIRVVLGVGENLIRPLVEPLGVTCHLQPEPKGTADAVRSAGLDSLQGIVMIINGDHPLMSAEDLRRYYLEFTSKNYDLALVSVRLKKPKSYGRVVRHLGLLKAIVEAKDASHETLKIDEVNTGIYFAKAELLKDFIPRIQPQNRQNEYYLTDLVALALSDNKKVGVIEGRPSDIMGVNTQAELAKVTRIAYRRKAEQLLASGVILIDPRSTYIEDEVTVGLGSVLYPNVYLFGRTQIGNFCVIEPNCLINDSKVFDSVKIKMGSHIEKAIIRKEALVGPYARIRPDSDVGEEAHIGNFVELKKVKFGAKAKANHLTYLGDAEIGEETNIGCGTITCNYASDRKKYVTKIGRQVFVGSDTQFVAPVEIGDGAYIGSGSTITKDVPAKALAVTRAHQIVKENYQPKKKE